MTNAPFAGLEDFRDLDSINAYRELTAQGRLAPDEMLRCLRRKSRDNARTPFQWSNAPQAGFTTGTPWIMVNPNYREINAAEQLARPDSVLQYYRRLLRLRKRYAVIVYGHYDLLLPDSPALYAYTRTLDTQRLLVLCNFTAREVPCCLPDGLAAGTLLLANYPDCRPADRMLLRPYEALAVLQENEP